MAQQQQRLNVRVGAINATVLKAGRGEPLIYLHGAFGYQGWPEFLDILSRNFTVYAPVSPGFSESNGLDQIDDLLDLTFYHIDLLEALGLEAPNLAGHYFGAMIAAEMAAVCTHSVNKLVLASPAGIWLDEAPGIDYNTTPMSEMRGILFDDSNSKVARKAMPDPANDQEKAEMHIERVRSFSTVGKFLWPIPDKGLKKRLRRIKSPALVIVAQNDQIVPPAHGVEIVNGISNAQLKTVQGAGHLFILERPDEFASLVTEFLNR